MNCLQVNAQLTVADLVSCWQETIPVLVRHRMACVGCPMSPCETLESAAAVYGLKLESFLDELQQMIPAQEVGT